MALDQNSKLGVDVAYPADARLSMASGALLVAMDVAARWETPPGGHPDDPNVGSVHLLRYVNEGFTGPDDPRLYEIEHLCVQEAQKDKRVDDITVDVALVAGAKPGTYHLRITGNGTTASGPFELVLGVDGVTTETLKIEA